MKFELTDEEIQDVDFLVSEFFVTKDNGKNEPISNLLKAYKLGYSNVLILKFNEDVDYERKCDWLLNYCEHILANKNLQNSKENTDGSDKNIKSDIISDEDNKEILLIVGREFEKHIRKDIRYLYDLKYTDNVIIKYSDKLSSCINGSGKISIIEIMLRIHELFKNFKIKYVIINEFERLVDSSDFHSNETKSIVNSLLFSLIVNMRSIKSEHELKIVIIE
ncbi:hypothetical protein FG386_002387 [Cryptosporidium ryanae]|uniref:uncharacterized protein n=1 Tax=Cryptosporidium ryanae TaxID=515981 RepID=UPI00351A654A|nr:hypothetical protein FG386_002387 [Cryptosporidium ryanae]